MVHQRVVDILASRLIDSRPQPARADREAWADIGKGISMILLVTWHVSGFHPAFSFLRMPLFFFVSGLYSRRSICSSSFNDFLRTKVGNMLYLYALWALAFFAVGIVPSRGAATFSFVWRWLQILWEPPATLWFIYVLALSFLLARLLRKVPFGLVLLSSLLIFAQADLQIGGRNPALLDRLGWLFPFFWLGAFSRTLINPFFEGCRFLWPLFLAAYAVLALSVTRTDIPFFHALYFAISVIGIAGVLLFAHAIAPSRFGRVLAVVGGSTLYIFLMHRIVLLYLNRALQLLGVNYSWLAAAKVAFIVGVCIVVGRRLSRSDKFSWLVKAPWLKPHGPTSSGQPKVLAGASSPSAPSMTTLSAVDPIPQEDGDSRA